MTRTGDLPAGNRQALSETRPWPRSACATESSSWRRPRRILVLGKHRGCEEAKALHSFTPSVFPALGRLSRRSRGSARPAAATAHACLGLSAILYISRKNPAGPRFMSFPGSCHSPLEVIPQFVSFPGCRCRCRIRAWSLPCESCCCSPPSSFSSPASACRPSRAGSRSTTSRKSRACPIRSSRPTANRSPSSSPSRIWMRIATTPSCRSSTSRRRSRRRSSRASAA